MRFNILITAKDIKDVLSDCMGNVTDKDLEKFIDYLKDDVSQWLRDNAKTFIRDRK